jgi:hypothetical protein
MLCWFVVAEHCGTYPSFDSGILRLLEMGPAWNRAGGDVVLVVVAKLARPSSIPVVQL